MVTEESLPLEEMNKEELLEQLEGGLYALLTETEEYEQLVQMAVALGIKDFVNNVYGGSSANEIIEVFSDGEQALGKFVAFAGSKGLIDLDEDEE
ncbi:hypothetical protein GGQ74_003099 [Desulfobaculum xiamenense]|uniref:Uncharacterized protein n=1 Tax=Desulfobaculum xiamenense TaxID=995050 RepID=A0A846QQE7_9BACT|nr:hypothetical protein [Desulfobaculum xiamenense]NJB69397.1 hypothetical protein [Desulfobaculum xiamenense]